MTEIFSVGLQETEGQTGFMTMYYEKYIIILNSCQMKSIQIQ